jgi:RNA polymerase sigma factor (TIGR02999 family)
MENTPGEVTQLLLELRDGNREAANQLIPLVYKELRRIASRYLRNEPSGHSLRPTELVHEAYLRLAQIERIDWQGRSHFFALSATLMRRILVDRARARRNKKRGLGWEIISVDDGLLPSPQRPVEIVALDEALVRLAVLDERQSKIVELRFFGGLNEEETGSVLGISTRTVKRDWRLARAWLYQELNCRPN